MNRVHPDKLEQSKWTAVNPVHGEKHFLIVQTFRDRYGHVQDVLLEAVLTRKRRRLHWRTLNDDDVWLPGWR